MILHPIIDLLKRIVVALPDYAGGNGLELLADHTATEDVAVINIEIPSDKQTMDVYNVVLNGSLSVSDWLYPHLNTTQTGITGDSYYLQTNNFDNFQIRIVKANSTFNYWYLIIGKSLFITGLSAGTSLQNILFNLYSESSRFSSGFNVKVYGGMLS